MEKCFTQTYVTNCNIVWPSHSVLNCTYLGAPSGPGCPPLRFAPALRAAPGGRLATILSATPPQPAAPLILPTPSSHAAARLSPRPSPTRRYGPLSWRRSSLRLLRAPVASCGQPPLPQNHPLARLTSTPSAPRCCADCASFARLTPTSGPRKARKRPHAARWLPIIRCRPQAEKSPPPAGKACVQATQAEARPAPRSVSLGSTPSPRIYAPAEKSPVIFLGFRSLPLVGHSPLIRPAPPCIHWGLPSPNPGLKAFRFVWSAAPIFPALVKSGRW